MLLPQQIKIIELSFKNTEQLGQTESERKAIYDIYCENEIGEKFIVELQKAKQNYFKERTIYYSTFTIREQADKVDWNYNLKAVYCIGILDFTFDDYKSEPEKSEVVHTIRLKNQNGKTFYEKLTYSYLEMPNFKLKENELLTRLDKWLYFSRHLEDFQTTPTIFKDEIFTRGFEKAKLARRGQVELDRYENSLKIYRDLKGVIETAYDDGKLEERLEIANRMKQKGLPIKDIAELTRLFEEEIQKL